MDAFEGFIRHRLEDTRPLALFPGVINSGVAVFYQQQLGLLPRRGLDEFPYDTGNGKLVTGRSLATRLHWWFINHEKEYCEAARSIKNTPIFQPKGDRASINLFAVLPEDVSDLFNSVLECGYTDDEHCSTVYSTHRLRRHAFDLSFTVSHLTFGPQSEGFDYDSVYSAYEDLAEREIGRLRRTESLIS